MKTTNNQSTTLKKSKSSKSHPFWRWFWLTFLVVSLAYAWYSFYVPSNDVAWSNDMKSAKELAIDSDKNILLFFTGDWCVPCRIMKREIFADKGVAKALNSKVVPVMIDVDDPNAKDLLTYYKIGGTPVTIFTDAQGKVLDYAVGKMEKEEFLEMLNNLNTSGL